MMSLVFALMCVIGFVLGSIFGFWRCMAFIKDKNYAAFVKIPTFIMWLTVLSMGSVWVFVQFRNITPPGDWVDYLFAPVGFALLGTVDGILPTFLVAWMVGGIAKLFTRRKTN